MDPPAAARSGDHLGHDQVVHLDFSLSGHSAAELVVCGIIKVSLSCFLVPFK